MKSTRKILAKILSPYGYEAVEVLINDENPSADKPISTPRVKPSPRGCQPIPAVFQDVPLTPPNKEEKSLISTPAKPAPLETNHCKFM